VTTEDALRSNAPGAPAPRSLLRTLATYREPRLIAVLFMGFSSGLPLALSAGTLQVWQTRAGVDLGTIGFFVLVGVVYSLKFVWAPFMDRIALPGWLGRLGRRRGWAILTQLGLLATIVLLGAGDPVAAPAWTALCAVLVAFCSASQDIVIDAYRIELLDDNQQGAGAAMTQIGYRFGMIASGAGALWLHADGAGLSWSGVYLVMAALVAVGIVTVLLTREPPDRRGSLAAGQAATRGWYALVLAGIAGAAVGAFVVVKYAAFGGIAFADSLKWLPTVTAIVAAAGVPVLIVLMLPPPRPEARAYADLHRWLDQSVIAPFKDLARHQGWLVILLFVVLFKLGDAFAGSIANAFYVKTGFTDGEIAWVSKTFGPAVTLAGVATGGLLVARIGLLPSLLAGGIVQMLSNLMFAWQAMVGHDVNFLMLTIGLENFASGIGSAAFVAYLSGLCSVSFTGTQYALLTSLAAVGRTVLSSPGGGLAKLIGWFDFFVMSTFMALPGLLLLLWMMRRYPPPTRAASAR
jgi:MFS transporter, PAT family, beta-lactamase induction signal transducer AmpG